MASVLYWFSFKTNPLPHAEASQIAFNPQHVFLSLLPQIWEPQFRDDDPGFGA
jgi:hypothetical protein